MSSGTNMTSFEIKEGKFYISTSDLISVSEEKNILEVQNPFRDQNVTGCTNSGIYCTYVPEQLLSLHANKAVTDSKLSNRRGATQNFREFARNNMNTYFKS
jgi:hypothetical protein